ncbi:hypothetical protein TWF173_010187 [Orbilia oligospora]|uniref:Adhesin domain-containing protein n=1 Tax=Arthrobotrys oligospora (strain ATCC 24927 / CBS 115.81 / DSM 1491) TaxID=756982 RepID=G1X054_ARTOA|nr:hypothetical protein AOL_s00006g255 [Orbilia oligospora ATCC 24927]EGX53389.1 hypothetical protein AOL_s00006g255 [Orbilia oligospora ATCC 24927]KAF3309966.1 hypothetical protein TWF173_010187 [Orbilia oligospora]
MERRENPLMEEYASSNPYITDNGVPTMPLDGFVADGFRPGSGPRLPMVVVNPYITATTETTADMAVTDGYFNGRPHQQLPVVHLPDEDPVKTAMPEPTPRDHTTENDETQVASPRPSQDDDRQTVYSRVSFGSERSTLPPSYTSRPMSRRVSYEEEDRDGESGHGQATEIRPLIMGECLCRHPQCISCVANGTAYRDREERSSWRKRLRCARGCTRGGVAKRRSRKFRFCCASIFFLIFTWVLFGGLMWRDASNRLKQSMEYMSSSSQCGDMLPGLYDESFTVPINNSLSSFSLRQSVVYDTPKDHFSTRINVGGTVYLEHASKDEPFESDDAKVTVKYMVSDETVLRDIDIRMTGNGVVIHTNAYTTQPAEDQREVCVDFVVTVKFPKHASTTELEHLLIDTEHLSIVMRPSLSLKVHDKALLNSITGMVWSGARQQTKIQDDEKLRSANFGLQARHLLVGTTTGNILGVWGLADSASFETKSGNIDIGVNSVTSFSNMSPQTDFTVNSVSGDVAIHSVSTDGALHPFHKDLKKYNTVIRTISGNIIGQYLLGSSLSVQSISGDIRADILPISPTGAGSSLEESITLDTDTKSGRTHMSFLEATDAKILTEPQTLLRNRAVQTVLSWIEDKQRKIWQVIQKHCSDHDEKSHTHGDVKASHAGHAEISHPDPDVAALYVDPQDMGLANLSFFKAMHTTVSGEVFVHYSAAFEGRVKASSLTGDIEVAGENVKIIRNSRNGPVGKIVEAVHGNSEDGFVESKTISGDIKICIGDARW